MINEKELEAVTLSPTKKDFYQIWNELLDTAKKISNRWDPSATNESDPGVVLLKVLAAIGDKLNYNIDKNILEAFMPSASQQESMRKLCEMMGYYMKYYRSAKTTATITYKGDWTINDNNITEIKIPKFTSLTDEDEQINYITLDNIILYNDTPFDTVDCIEGQLCQCENSSNSNNLITTAQLDDNFRYYLPESQIAENGIFIYSNISESTAVLTEWTREENLNIQKLGYTCFKVGFDSKKKVPYLQFPTDVAGLMGDGLSIYYIRTNGVNGNISAKTLSKLTKPDAWSTFSETTGQAYYKSLSLSDFTVTNIEAAMNGYNMETIDEAYNSYKKTIGTFDTLVTCRDYMNKIYQLTEDEISTIPLVSNIIVSDIRDDINNSFSLCSFNDYGIKYTDKIIDYRNNGEKNKFNHFDILLYPFKTIRGLNTKTEYVNSFKYSRENILEIENELENYKTISHTLNYPESSKYTGEGFADIICIKNYLRLNAKITTTYKVNTTEEASILSAIYSSIYNDFNLRKLDFGETIPFDSILKCIENADTRIKNVSLEEPILYTTFLTADNEEWDIASQPETGANAKVAKLIYNKLALRNILAGKVALFNYNNDFKFEFSESKYPSWTASDQENLNVQKTQSIKSIKNDSIYSSIKKEYASIYPTEDTHHLTRLTSECLLTPGSTELTLNDNEVIQFRAPSLKTTVTYPAYVNYYLKLDDPAGKEAIAAQFTTLGEFLAVALNDNSDRWDDLMTKKSLQTFFEEQTCNSTEKFSELLNKYGALWQTEAGTTRVRNYSEISENKVYGLPINGNTFGKINEYVKSLTFIIKGVSSNYTGLYRSLGWSSTRIPGYLTTVDCIKYHLANTYNSSLTLTTTYVQFPNGEDSGLGKDAELGGISKNEEYQLRGTEFLLVNYTETTDSNDSTQEETVKNIKYEAGTILRPNFLLSDSFTKNQTGGISFTKTTGFEFSELSKSEGKNGMYTLGSSEQIEIRNKTELNLGWNESLKAYSTVYVYWDLEEDTEKENTDNNYVTFPFVIKDVESHTFTYTLKAGEYFYFTDANKTDLNYYGEGTEIIKTGDWILRKEKSTSETTDSEAILAQGMSAIPWERLTSTEVNHLTFREFQLINLVKNDKLIMISESNDLVANDMSLDNTWKKCKAAEYLLSTATSVSTLPKFSFTDTDMTWEVRSLLQFNMSNTLTQTLHRDSQRQDIITAYRYRVDGDGGTTPEVKVDTFTPQLVNDEYIPLSLRSNYVCQAAADEKIVKVWKESLTDEGEIVEVNDFKLKLFKDIPPEISYGSSDSPTSITLNNFGDHWTKVSTKDFKTSSSEGTLTLHINIPNKTVGTANYFGLVMIYVVSDETEVKKLPYLTSLARTNETIDLKIFNYIINDTESWWPDYKIDNKYYLHAGINVVKLENSMSLTIHPDTSFTTNIIFGDIDIINNINNGINLDILNYNLVVRNNQPNVNSAAEQLLNDINTWDTNHDFYYNCPIERSEALDINTTLDSSGKPIETLSSATTWYDYNNVNNKFVVSEIDSAYMKSGITLTKSSKRGY